MKSEKSVSWALQCTGQGVLVGRRRRCRRLAFNGFKPGITVAAGQTIRGQHEVTKRNQGIASLNCQTAYCALLSPEWFMSANVCCLFPSGHVIHVFAQLREVYLIRAARLAHIQDF